MSSAGDRKIKVGSRKSELALIQTRHVISLLKELHPEKEFEIVTMSTLGDKILDVPLPKIGEKSLFTKELEHALTTGCVDFLVHSLKDLPTTLPDGMAIGAVLTREDPRDALVLHNDYKTHKLSTLPPNSTLGTSSLRRTAQLARKYPNVKVENIRGNLNTRLRKLDELRQFHGVVLAKAGLERMGWHNRISQVLESDDLMYAVGQGALAVECRESDLETIAMLRPLYDIETALTILAERSFLKTLGGGCSAPVAVSTELKHISKTTLEIQLKGGVWSLNGSEELTDNERATVEIREKGKRGVCPYGYKSEEACKGDEEGSLKDAECASGSKFVKNTRKFDEVDDANVKRAKIENPNLPETTDNHLVPTEVIAKDPHSSWPIDIPVGQDFMGKCPYLETAITNASVDLHTNLNELDVNKCPFFKESAIQVVPDVNNGICPYREPKLYCGLVPHPGASDATFEVVQTLGEKLAEKLIKLGAGDVMTKAQAQVRNSV